MKEKDIKQKEKYVISIIKTRGLLVLPFDYLTRSLLLVPVIIESLCASDN